MDENGLLTFYRKGEKNAMLGFHTDGIRLFGASDTLLAALKKRQLPLVKTSTTNTLVFAVNVADVLTKKLYQASFLAPQAPWFSCVIGDAPRPAEYSLRFATEEDLAEFITALYYCSQGFLHLDFELAELVQRLNPGDAYRIRAFEEKDFHKIGESPFAACFCFLEGGFMESDRLFRKLTHEYGVGADKILLAGSFDSKHQFLRAFIPQRD